MALSVHVVSAANPIILHSYDWKYGVSPFDQLLPNLSQAPTTLLLSLSWTVLLRPRLERLIQDYKAYMRQRPQHRFVFLANMPEEDVLLRKHGLHSIFCPHNAFLDERLYIPLEREKLWQGIINSRMRPFKRIHLAAELDSCCLITYATKDSDYEYDASLWQVMPQLYRPQYEGKTIKTYFTAEQLREYYARSACGLILSASEGGCFASSEYLLCGLPVVSTLNEGGRNVFFHKDYTYFCQPTTQGVRLATEAALQCRASAQDIRNLCLERMGYFRQKYVEMLYAEAAAHGYASTFHCDLQKIFCNKMITPYATMEDAVAYLTSVGICEKT